jgi:phosphoribosylformylglycinamidine (FGAM) synthase PurS component
LEPAIYGKKNNQILLQKLNGKLFTTDSIANYLLIKDKNIDSAFSIKMNAQMALAEAKYSLPILKEDISKKESEIKKSKNKSIILISILIICFTIFSAIIYFIIKRKKLEHKKTVHSIMGTFTALQQNVQSTVKNNLSQEKYNELNFKLNQSVSFFKTFEISSKNGKFSPKQVITELLNYFALANSNIVDVNYNVEDTINLKDVKPLAEMLQELLINTVKYAKPTYNTKIAIGVSIKGIKDNLSFHYYDNGTGFVGDEPIRKGSMGIDIIKQNAKRIGGTYQFWNDKGLNFSLVKT